MAFSFERYVQKSNEFMNAIAMELGHPDDTDRAYRIFRSVMHALRDNIPVEENLHLMAQLPMMIKAVYVDNWKVYGEGRNVRHLDEFVQKVMDKNTNNYQRDLKTPDQTKQAIESVFNVLKRNVSEGEIEDIMNMLPADIKPLLQ